jgi:hypothetical protein
LSNEPGTELVPNTKGGVPERKKFRKNIFEKCILVLEINHVFFQTEGSNFLCVSVKGVRYLTLLSNVYIHLFSVVYARYYLGQVCKFQKREIFQHGTDS